MPFYRYMNVFNFLKSLLYVVNPLDLLPTLGDRLACSACLLWQNHLALSKLINTLSCTAVNRELDPDFDFEHPLKLLPIELCRAVAEHV